MGFCLVQLSAFYIVGGWHAWFSLLVLWVWCANNKNICYATAAVVCLRFMPVFAQVITYWGHRNYEPCNSCKMPVRKMPPADYYIKNCTHHIFWACLEDRLQMREIAILVSPFAASQTNAQHLEPECHSSCLDMTCSLILLPGTERYGCKVLMVAGSGTCVVF